jgi:hypothetical protein
MTLTRPDLARALLAAIMLAAATTVGAQPFDHLECYKIKDLAPKVKYKADLLPEQTQFLAQTGCELKVPAKVLCIDVEKSNVMPAPPQAVNGQNTRDFLCYSLKCPPQAEVSLQVEDQFGSRDIRAKKKPFQLCAPAREVCQVQFGQVTATYVDETEALIEWSTVTETGIADYVVEKRGPNDTAFTPDGAPAPATGPGSYSHVSSPPVDFTLYRIRANCAEASNTFYSDSTQLSFP